MADSDAKHPPSVFVIMSFDQAWDDAYLLGIKPVCEAVGAVCNRVDHQIHAGRIIDRIYREIETADLIVAEMSGKKPNVFYEAGYAHGLGKPVIFLTANVEDIPFDMNQYPHIVHGGSITTFMPRLEETLAYFLEHPEEASAAGRSARGEDDDDLERVAQHIVNYLNSKGYKMVSFDRIRENINPEYSDDLLFRLIDVSPRRFRRVRMRGGRPGIGLVE